MSHDADRQWTELRWWVRLYAWLALAGVVYGVFAAHLPFMLGYPWSTCEVGGWLCKLTFHLIEIPLSTVNLVAWWYGLRRFDKSRVLNFLVILIIGVASNLAFFAFEGGLILDGLWKSAPMWEYVVLFTITSFTAFGIFLGLFLALKIVEYEKSRRHTGSRDDSN